MAMEATVYYHYILAQLLYKNNVSVSVLNPLSVKRFIQMKLAKGKTDKSDAKVICNYAIANEAPLYNTLTDIQAECLQLFRLMESYLKKRTATKNKMHGEDTLGIPSKFETVTQLCSYVGITPTIRKSGSSVRGRSRITKVANKKLRNLLFLCAFNACMHNEACRELYERIVNKGKSKKLALIAVANKLLKQCFTISKSGLPYDPEFVSVLAVI